ncbi:MAG: LLM class flavin-dependent oxidoreductase [Candidatus Hodarchaeales archaeon]|jgi:alkanesulfonate monooxygenase SsuD/methylene tetrahydromethanopterin reductase-like flavin-dependent oxidoreductase (luciferase family)
MEFGIYIRPGKSYHGMFDLTQHAENLGYYGVFINDHVHGFDDKGKEPYLEAWTVISGLAVQTSKIKIGHIVLFNSLRNPAFLAKSIATLDNMTNGRYEILIGAGWNESEYLGYDLMEKGRGMPSAKERVDRFEESLEILRGMLTNEEFSYEGKFWKLKNAINTPQPVKQMRISVGADKPRMIGIAARLADGLNLSGGLNGIKKGVDILHPALEKHNKSLDEYFLSGFCALRIAKTTTQYDEMAKDLAERSEKPVKDIKESAFIGTPEILIEKLHKAQDLGMKMIVISPNPATTQDERKELYDYFKDQVVTKL